MTEQPQIALVTGASSGRDIGAAICRMLAARGIEIFFTAWQAEHDWIPSFEAELAAFGVRTRGFLIDLADPAAAATVHQTVVATLGQPSILINNAAHSTQTDYLSLDAAALDAHYAVNIRTTFLLSVEFARHLQASSLLSGRIINMTSGQELGPMPGELAYVATKGAISAFTQTFAQEVAPFGITVNAVNPGPTDSTWMTDEIRSALLPKFPFGRIGTPNDVARLISFLVSDEGAWITGQILHSEGGFIRQ
ncbi:SDR family oxidoreductase [Exiguobacterium sp. s193]|uniref:SDR family oxidoreductase n=1 Tax=Exiguobacterium sp. s193 TaxID=2751207 RepID=UPI001BEC9094|nr:SDR family oxidoreductase [Exiguobacterium sp. s193]